MFIQSSRIYDAPSRWDTTARRTICPQIRWTAKHGTVPSTPSEKQYRAEKRLANQY